MTTDTSPAAVEAVYTVAGVRPTIGIPFSWYVIGPEGEVACCQMKDGEEHARMIAAALNDRVAGLADRTAEDDFRALAARNARLENRLANAGHALAYWQRESHWGGGNPKWASGPHRRGIEEQVAINQALSEKE